MMYTLRALAVVIIALGLVYGAVVGIHWASQYHCTEYQLRPVFVGKTMTMQPQCVHYERQHHER